jgi:3D (Asp-Asp-Asp) domain-containing protein
MNQRQLDLALLAGIGVLLVVILILALSGAPRLAGDISDPVDRVNAAAAAAGDGAAARAPASDPDVTAAPEDDATTSIAAGEEVAEGEAADPAQADGAAAPPTGGATVPVAGSPVNSVPLERIGFAYATGSEGACGVPLTAWEYVAVSRDLLADYPCGSAVTLTLDDEIAGRRVVTAQVGDTMGADIAGTVNIFVGQDEPALEYGVTRGTLSR